MAKNPLITDDIRQLIATVYLENPDFRAKEIRKEVEARLLRANPKTKPNWPGLSAVQKILTQVRNRNTERPSELKELDDPWCIASMVKYPITAEALPHVLQLQVWIAEKINRLITIREALWAARLYTVTKNMEELQDYARDYALYEKIRELYGESYTKTFGRDLDVFASMTGQEIPFERKKAILKPVSGFSAVKWYLVQETVMDPIRTKMAKKEAQNERSHNKEIQG